MTPTPETPAGGLTAEDYDELASEIDGTENLLDLLADAATAMHDAVPDRAFVNVRPLQEAVLAVWLDARDARGDRDQPSEGVSAGQAGDRDADRGDSDNPTGPHGPLGKNEDGGA